MSRTVYVHVYVYSYMNMYMYRSEAGSARALSVQGGSRKSETQQGGDGGSVHGGSQAGSRSGSRASKQEEAAAETAGASWTSMGRAADGQGSLMSMGRAGGDGKKSNKHKYVAKRDFKGVLRGSQNAGLGTTHFDVSAPRHLSGLNPTNTVYMYVCICIYIYMYICICIYICNICVYV
jgi:hypothetical protein